MKTSTVLHSRYIANNKLYLPTVLSSIVAIVEISKSLIYISLNLQEGSGFSPYTLIAPCSWDSVGLPVRGFYSVFLIGW